MAIPLAGGGPRAPARQPPPSGPQADALLVACAAGAVRGGLAARPRIVRRLREASGAALVALGAGLLLSAAPARAQP